MNYFKIFFIFFFISFLSFSYSQDCNGTCCIELKGKVIDDVTNEELVGAVVKLVENDKIVFTNENGSFVIKNICSCEHCHIKISHFGCKPITKHISLKNDTSLIINLHHHVDSHYSVTINGKKEKRALKSTIQKEKIIKEGNKNLADALEHIEGVSTIRSGSGVSKPVVHGLYGNRVSIMNNEVPQSGQRWGADHAPEIDMFVANKLSVYKGATSMPYAGSTLGSVVSLDVAPIPKDPHLHGVLNYLYQTNGRGHTTNFQLENANKIVNFRMTGTLKRLGDMHSPDYYLTNTGRKENDFAIQFQKQIKKNWSSEAYYSCLLYTSDAADD